jgi:hypothetical protein
VDCDRGVSKLCEDNLKIPIADELQIDVDDSRVLAWFEEL